MFDTVTTALSRAILDEICEGVSGYEMGAKAHVASAILGSGHQRRDLARQPEIYRPQSPLRNVIHVAVVDAGPVNFQVTVLRILVSYPGGFASMADLKRDMAILATSGRDWAARTKRLASRVPDLDIFSQGLIERLNGGWRITDKGSSVLDLMEARPGANEPQRVEEVRPAPPKPAVPPQRLPAEWGPRRRERRQRRRAACERSRANAS
jgi:hypothetical protein